MKHSVLVGLGGAALLFWAASASAIVTPPKPPDEEGTTTVLPSDDPFTANLQNPWEETLDASARNRLTAERKAVAEELEKSLQFDPDKLKDALKEFHDGATDTPHDNIERTARALARVDANFGKAYDLYRKEKWADAAALLGDALAEEKPGYQAALKRLLYGECLQRQGRLKQAADAWQALVRKMPERLSFASTACLRLAETYEKMDRQYYALAIYKWWMQTYSFLDLKGAEGLTEKVAKLQAEYKDPLGNVADKMTTVGKRLEGTDSGQETQTLERKIVAILDDLIKAAEDQDQQQGKGQGKGQGQGQGQGMASGAPRGIGQPSSPATSSALVGGETSRPATPLSKARPSDGSDDWGKLKPREKQELIEAFKEMYPERYREMLEAYYKNLAESENRR